MSSSVTGIGAHALRGVGRGSSRKTRARRTPRRAKFWRGESGSAIAFPEQGGNVGLKCLILGPFLLALVTA
jgi:hypothetical protein